jgi:tRNA pseudouridine38-40 synthase
LIGRHDFASLVTRPAVRPSTERTVFAADWLEVSPSLVLFEICADAYLKQMVRTIVGSLLWVGLGRWRPDQFAAALNAADRRAAGPNAPALGLTLHRIDY